MNCCQRPIKNKTIDVLIFYCPRCKIYFTHQSKYNIHIKNHIGILHDPYSVFSK